LHELRYVEGRNIEIVYRYAENDQTRLPKLADEVVELKPDVIVSGPTAGVLANKQATATIQIVCVSMVNPEGFNLVTSWGRPRGQVTGV
jgi:putative ABC transport system substrate-binding protein